MKLVPATLRSYEFRATYSLYLYSEINNGNNITGGDGVKLRKRSVSGILLFRNSFFNNRKTGRDIEVRAVSEIRLKNMVSLPVIFF